MEMSWGIQSATGALFGQFESDSVFGREMEVDSSCFSLGFMIRKCLTSLLKLGLQDIRVVYKMLCFFTLKQEKVKWSYRLIEAPLMCCKPWP